LSRKLDQDKPEPFKPQLLKQRSTNQVLEQENFQDKTEEISKLAIRLPRERRVQQKNEKYYN
jgi:hypothetical protein